MSDERPSGQSRSSRRTFLVTTGTTAAATVVGALLHHATGVRVRELPVKIEDLLA